MSKSQLSILVIDDDEQVQRVMSFHLESIADKVLHCQDSTQALEMVKQNQPDLILLDFDMPGTNGLDLCRILKDQEETRDIPVIFLTGERSVSLIVRALDSGGADYITKPFEVIELQARVRAALRSKRLIDLLKENSTIDPLTGLGNRAEFQKSLELAISNLARYRQHFSLVMVDLDYFKQINDKHGHRIGDETLTATGKAIRAVSRSTDAACRFGGEEFAVILHRTSLDEGRLVAERMQRAIRSIRVPIGEDFLSVTASLGLACTETVPQALTSERLIELADQAMYVAKKQGRDRLVVAL